MIKHDPRQDPDYITQEMLADAAEATGYDDIDEDRVRDALHEYDGVDTADLKGQLRAAKTKFERAGGRGVALADEIDNMRIAIAARRRRHHYGNAAEPGAQHLPAKIESVGIIGRRWRDKTYGNTYNTAEIYVNGRKVHKVPFGYGYGSHYEDRAVEWLIENGYIKAEKYKHGGYPALHRLARDHGFHHESTVIDVPRKRDL